jgi:hypothetical protein
VKKPPAVTVHHAWRRTINGVIGPERVFRPILYAGSPSTTGLTGVRTTSASTAG